MTPADHRRFAGGTGDDAPPGRALWSGFLDAGVHELNEKSRIVLRGVKHLPVTLGPDAG